jgi:hypothetical protein
MSLTRRYVADDHRRFCELTFPDGLVPPLSITLESPRGTRVAFWYDPGPIESMSTANCENRQSPA